VASEISFWVAGHSSKVSRRVSAKAFGKGMVFMTRIDRLYGFGQLDPDFRNEKETIHSNAHSLRESVGWAQL
jgi:hypothetical protein